MAFLRSLVARGHRGVKLVTSDAHPGLVDAIFGPDIVTVSAGGDRSVVPSAVALALFAFLATWVVARYGFRRPRSE